MIVTICMLALLLFALATVALVYAVATAGDGCETENGFQCTPSNSEAREERPTDFIVGRPVQTVPVCWFI